MSPAGRVLPRRAGAAGRRRRARASPGRWTGPQHRCAGRGEPGLEAGAGGQRDVAGELSRYRITPSVTRSPPACCAPRWRRSRSAAPTSAPKRCATVVSELLGLDEPRRRSAAMMSGLDIQYDLGRATAARTPHARSLPRLTADGPLRVFTLLHDARPVLLNLGEPGAIDASRRGRIGCGWSTPSTPGSGNCRRSGWSPRPRPSDPARRLRRVGGRQGARWDC